MPTTSLAGNVQESKAQRLERLKSRFRNRGGIFVPSEVNPLVDILLARGINGESPVKKRSPRKSALTPKPRPSTSRTTTPRTGASKRAPRKSAFAASVGDENCPLSMKKRRSTSKTPKLQVSKRTNGMDASTFADLSLPQAAAQRKPFADQLAVAINSIKTPLQQGKRESALGKCRAKPAPVLVPRYSEEHKHFDEEHASKLIKCPVLTLVERQGREKQDDQTNGRGSAAPEVEQVNGARVKAIIPPLLHDQSGSSSDSDEPLAKKHAAAKSKRARLLAGTRLKPKTSKKVGSPPPTKKRGRSKVKTLPRHGVPEEGDVEPETVPLASTRRHKVAPNTNLTRTAMHIEVDSGGIGKEVQVLQEKIAPAPAKVARKRKERVKASVDQKDINNDDEHEYENTHELPQKKRRRADLTASRNAKENKEKSRSAREAAAKTDKPFPSPVKKQARTTSKPSSKAKAKVKTAKPRSRAGVSAKSGTRPRGLPPDVRRRIKVIAQNLLATDFDDDDPIDFLR